MKRNRKFLLGILLGLLFTGCSSLGENFFIRNYEDKTVSIKYVYFECNSDSTGFAFQPKNYVLISDTLLNKKVLKQFPYKSHLHFDTLDVNTIDSLSYEVEIPTKSTIRISPIYYTDNIESIIINNVDTIRFVSGLPYVENEEFTDLDILKYKPRLVGDSYYILNINLMETSSILRD